MSPRNKIALTILALGLLSGCADYQNHRDSITLGAGDANDGNIGIQTVDPFPANAENTDINVDGRKVKQAHDRYLAPCDPDIVYCATTTGG